MINRIPQELIDQYTGLEGHTALLDRRLSLLWSSDQTAESLVFYMLMQLPASDTEGIPILPMERPVLVQQWKTPLQCVISRVESEGETYIRMHFTAYTSPLTISKDSLYDLAVADNSFFDAQGIELLRIADNMKRIHAAPDTIRAVLNTAFSIRNRALHTSEAHWYADLQNNPNVTFKKQDLSLLLESFVDGLHTAIGRSIQIEPPDIEQNMVAAIDGKRLEYALLSLFCTLHAGNPEYTVFKLTAACTDAVHTIRMTFSNDQTQLTPAMLRIQNSANLTAWNTPEQMLKLFCESFHAEILKDPEQNGSLILRIPAEPYANVTQLCCDDGLRAINTAAFTKYPVMLSEIFDASALS